VSRAEGQSDVHRTGAKCVPGGPQDSKLPGSAYHSVLAVRTKPGRGDPTSSLSCSDKISKWCVVGFQGALLSMLIDHKLTFASIILPSNCPYSEASLKRAIVSRLPLSCSFPMFMQSSVAFPHYKVTGKPCPTSLIWSDAAFLGHKKLEMAVDGRRQGLTKSKALTPLGRLKMCKRELFSVFCEIAPQCGVEIDSSDSYRNFKDKALEYQNLWNSVKTLAFPEWPVKEKEFEIFSSSDR
jgi:tRNA-specific adenosine deaminase 1